VPEAEGVGRTECQQPSAYGADVPTRVIPVSSENQLFQRAEVLYRNRTKRQRYRQFLVEGVRPIDRLVESGWAIQALLYTPDRALSGWARRVLAGSRAPVHYELTLPLLSRLTDRQEPSELIAIATVPPDEVSRIHLGAPSVPLLVACDSPASPGNLGAIIRSADAFGADAVVVTGHAADVYDPQAVRASMGSLFALPVVRMSGPEAVARWLSRLPRSLRPIVVGTDSGADVDLDLVDLKRSTLLVAGSETGGLHHGYRRLCDVVARIPMRGSADSLNVASAISVALYEVDRQRRQSGG
jgi:23S rRNA (uridine2479-2'-O)-methyltransferase